MMGGLDLRRAKVVTSVLAIVLILLLSCAVCVLGKPVGGSGEADINAAQGPRAAQDARQPSPPQWRAQYGDCSLYADSDGFVDVIVYSPKGLAHRISQEKADHIYSKAFTGYSARLTVGEVQELLESDPYVQIMPDLPMKASVSIQYNSTGADILWNQTDGGGDPIKGDGITVAVIDTGISYSHSDLGGGFGPTYRVVGGYDFVNNDADPNDDNGHGTHCAGIIGANGTVKGMAPECTFYAYKVLGSGGTGVMSDATLGIERAMDPNDDDDTSDHVDVISMSMGGAGSSDDATCLAVQAAIDAGVVVVVAAGNEGPTFGSVSSPGLAEHALTVGSVGQDGEISGFSSRGTQPNMLLKPEISAPGEAIYSTWLYGSYASQSGTSMATPHVAGACALLIQAHDDWDPYQVKSAIISGCYQLPDSLWNVGAGRLWVPNASAEEQFCHPGMGSYETDYGSDLNISLTNTGSLANFTITSEDWHTLFGNYTLNGTLGSHDATSLSSVDLGYIELDTDETGYINLQVSEPGLSLPEGYYSGIIYLTNDSYSFSIRFGFAVMSAISLYVIADDGHLISDSTGEVYVFSTPDCTIIRSKTAAASGYAPPMVTHLCSGDYSSYAIGHSDVYTYDDTYLLHNNFTVGRLTDREVYLNITDARKLVLNLTTEDDHPIYIKEYRSFFRHVGEVNLSADKSAGDYSIEGGDMFTLDKHKTIYVSDTTDTVGFAIVGYSYSDPLWDFMEKNYDHWYEYVSGISTDFNPVSTTDLQYMLSWEFDGVDGDTDTDLCVNWSRASAYQTKYNIPGLIESPYQDWGTHKGMGASASFYVLRDTDTSVEPFFSGMNRTTIVQGPHLEYYSSLGLFEGITKPMLFDVDWDYTSEVTSTVDSPDRNYVSELSPANATREIGGGPAYVSGYLENTADLFTLYHPLFKELTDTRWDSKSSVTSQLYRGTSVLGYYSLSEINTALGARKMLTNTWGSGTYSWRMTINPCDTISDSFVIEWRWVVPNADVTPPRLTGFELDHRFTPGESLPVLLEAVDDVSGVTSALDWRNGSGDSWHSVGLSESPSGNFTGSIATSATTATIDLRVNVSDATGNYLSYTISNYAYAEVDVIFDLRTNWTGNPQIPYTTQEQYLTLYGNLTDGEGDPLHTSAGVPIDLFVDGNKVATIIDEYVTAGAHTHNGSIRYEWHFKPTEIFTASGQTKTVTAFFDLGVYEPVTVSFDMDSVSGPDIAPVITLHSPSNNSAFLNGQLIDIDVEDESLLTVNYSLDGAANVTYAFPYMLDTTDWTEGYHNLTVRAADSNTTTTVSYTFRVDRQAPDVEITHPADMGSVYTSDTVTIDVFDNSTVYVYWSVDDGVRARDYAPYGLPLTGYSDGWYNVTCIVHDPYGHSSTDTVQLYVGSDAPQLTNSPGTVGTESVEYGYNATCTSPDSGITNWQLVTNATWLSMSSNSSTHCNLSGTPDSQGYFWANLSLNDTDSGDYVNWTITVTGDLPGPSITSTEITGVREDHLYSYDGNADQGVTWALETNASFLEVASATGVVSGTPNNSHAELSYFVNLSCSNANGTDYCNYSLFVYNTAPAFDPDSETPPITCTVYQPYSYQANHSDRDVGTPPGNFTDILTNYTGDYTFTGGGLLTFTPSELGNAWFNITADDQRGVANSTSTLNWTVTFTVGGTHAITSSPITTGVEDSLYSYDLTANQTVTWGLVTNASFLNLVGSTVSGTPTNAHGNQQFSVNISALTMNGTVYQDFTLSVLNRAPSISSTPGTSVVNRSAYGYNAIADDEGIGTPPGNYTGITTNYSESYSFNEDTGQLSFTANLAGSFWFNITFDDQTGAANATTTQNWTITIDAIPGPAITSSPSGGIDEDTGYYYDADADQVVTWGLTTNASFLAVVIATGVVSGTPTNAHAEHTFYVNVSCSNINGTDFVNYTLTVYNKGPSISSTPASSVVNGSAYSYDAIADDEGIGTPAGNYTDLSTNYSEAYSFTEATGLITFTANLVGIYWFNLTFDDQSGAANATVYQNFTVTISALSEEPDTPQPMITTSAKAAFSYVVIGDTIHLNDLSYGDVVRWMWTFGDGYGAISQNPSHKYYTSGRYVVSLTVVGLDGRTSSAQTTITVVLSADNLVDEVDDGWRVYVSDDRTLDVNAVGLVIVGGFLLFAGSIMRSLPYVGPDLLKLLGIIMILAGAYYFV